MMLDIRRETTGRISIVGHRGAPAAAPENTLASFREALRQGADIVELDVQLSVDGEVVVLHDDRLERTTDGQGLLVEHTLAELKALDAGSWFAPRFGGERIPTLGEMLVWARDRVPLFVELKHSHHSDPDLDAAVVRLIQRHAMTDRVMLISFDPAALYRVKQHAPALATAVLYDQPVANPVGLAQEIDANGVMPMCPLITADQVTACHRAGLTVNVWGAGCDYKALASMGVDCVNADDPARVRQILSRHLDG